MNLGRAAVLAAFALLAWAPPPADAAFEPGTRVLLDAHNCYPYNGRWANRIDRALSTGTPLAIEQDLVWFRDPGTGQGRSLVAHDEPGKPALGLTGHEPTLREYFFERIRPAIEQALREDRRATWPIITLNLDLKTEEPEHLADSNSQRCELGKAADGGCGPGWAITRRGVGAGGDLTPARGRRAEGAGRANSTGCNLRDSG